MAQIVVVVVVAVVGDRAAVVVRVVALLAEQPEKMNHAYGNNGTNEEICFFKDVVFNSILSQLTCCTCGGVG